MTTGLLERGEERPNFRKRSDRCLHLSNAAARDLLGLVHRPRSARRLRGRHADGHDRHPKGSLNKVAYDAQFGEVALTGVVPVGAPFPTSACWAAGKPLDVLVMDARAFSGCNGPSRLIGVIEPEQTEDDKTEKNDRILAVSAKSATYRLITGVRQAEAGLVKQIEFFMSYDAAKHRVFESTERGGSVRAAAIVQAGPTKNP